MPVFFASIETPLPPDEAVARVGESVRTESGWWESFGLASESAKGKPFSGTVGDASFKITRVIWYRNSFRPVVHGRVEAAVGGCVIRLSMRLPLFTAAFMACWVCGLGSPALAWFLDPRGPFPGDPTTMAVFGLVMTLLGFYPEAFIAGRVLRARLAPRD